MLLGSVQRHGRVQSLHPERLFEDDGLLPGPGLSQCLDGNIMFVAAHQSSSSAGGPQNADGGSRVHRSAGVSGEDEGDAAQSPDEGVRHVPASHDQQNMDFNDIDGYDQ